jgi:hypothetical protein
VWLLDANMDVHLASILAGFGIVCDTAGDRGGKALSNGNLVKAAVDAGFRCLLTRDRLFGESASRALKSFPQFAVVVVNVPQQRCLDIGSNSLPDGQSVRSSPLLAA